MAFEKTLAETCELFGWRMHAYVIMRNHYHLALTTPQANLTQVKIDGSQSSSARALLSPSLRTWDGWTEDSFRQQRSPSVG